jgi:hypothetical protein
VDPFFFHRACARGTQQFDSATLAKRQTMSENHDRAVSALERMTALIKEHREATIYENCLYDVRPVPGMSRYILFEISTKQEVAFGDAKTLRTWLQRRQVDPEKVYAYDCIMAIERSKPEDTGLLINGRPAKRLEY